MNRLLVQNALLAILPFASPAMLWWALAAVVPLLIHLWSRRKHDEVPWAAMRFLLAAVRKNSRRWRLEQLVLLAVRIAMLVILAIALADPILSLVTGEASDQGEQGNTYTVIVIDASCSMDYRPVDATCFEMAKGQAAEWVRRGRQGDAYSLIRFADPPQIVVGQPVFDREAMVTEIAQLERTDGGADLPATLALVDSLTTESQRRSDHLSQWQVVFVTDLDATSWSEVTKQSVQDTLARLTSRGVRVTLSDVGKDEGQNVAVTRLSMPDAVLTVGKPTRVDVEVQGFGQQRSFQRSAQVLVDGRRVARLDANVGSDRQVNLSAMHRFQVPGDHVVEVVLDSDQLAADDHRWMVVAVRERLRVLCVEGKAGSAANVTAALQPNKSSDSPIEPIVRSEIALLEEDLTEYDAVFLCNVGRFGSDEARLLRQFLERGGGVVFFLGDQVQGANYNTILGPDAEENGCFSSRLGEASPLGEYLLDPLDYQHPIVAPFRGHERAGLLSTPIWKYVRVSVDATSPATTAVAFQDRSPLILEETIGAGRVVMVTTAASSLSVDRSTDPPTPWSALTAWPSFPPLVHQVLYEVVRGQPELRNLVVGEAVRGTLPTGIAETSVQIVGPRERAQQVPVSIDEGVARWSFAESQLSGVYRASWSDSAAQPYAVNMLNDESRMERWSAELLPQEFQRFDAKAVRDQHGSADEMRVPVYRYLLSIVLCLLLFETFLAWFFDRRHA